VLRDFDRDEDDRIPLPFLRLFCRDSCGGVMLLRYSSETSCPVLATNLPSESLSAISVHRSEAVVRKILSDGRA
jgi:hypothetical protein